MKLVVKQDPIRKDRATTSEMSTQIQHDVRAAPALRGRAERANSTRP